MYFDTQYFQALFTTFFPACALLIAIFYLLIMRWNAEDEKENVPVRLAMHKDRYGRSRLMIFNEKRPRKPVMAFDDFYGMLPCGWAMEGAR